MEEEFYLSGVADAYATTGAKLASDCALQDARDRPSAGQAHDFNGTVLVEWQNVTAGYDLDALWNRRHMREGYAWVGVSAQRVGVNQLRGWSPARYGTLDVTGGGLFTTDQLSYDIFAQAAQAVKSPGALDLLGGLDVKRVLAIGASQSAGRMTVYYNVVLPQESPIFDGYAFIVARRRPASAPSRSSRSSRRPTCTTPLNRRPDSDVFRRWEVAGAAHSGWEGREYRIPLEIRDLGAETIYSCTNPPFSRIWLSQAIEAAYGHLSRWVDGGSPPPSAPYLEFAPTTKARNALGLALGGIQLSQLAVPTALNTGLELGTVVLPPIRHARAVRRRAAGRSLPQSRQLRLERASRRSRQRGRGLPAACGRAGEPARGRPVRRRTAVALTGLRGRPATPASLAHSCS